MNSLADVFVSRRYSQFGEDAVLAWLFHDRRNGFYVDVGCHHPYRLSNTALLHAELGWTGINIDVDERATALFDQHRPGDINITMAVGARAGRQQVTIFEEGAFNSLATNAASDPALSSMPRIVQEVEVQPLGAILHRIMPPGKTINLLNIDAEGLDIEILISNDWANFCPEIILVEVHGFDLDNVKTSPTYIFLRDKGYKLISHVAVTSVYRRTPGLTDDEVIWLYRCLLGRAPDSPETIVWFQSENSTFEQGRDYLRRSEEFKIKNDAVTSQYYIPERFPSKYVKTGMKKLALAAIVKNENRRIVNMLQSCAPLLDYAVVVDTGSTDGTLEIARATLKRLGVPHTVDKVPFVDFSQSRNAAIDLVPKQIDWILVLDADEEIVPSDYWRFAELLEASDDVDGWQLPRMNFKDLAKRKPLDSYPDRQGRLFRNRPSNPVRFVGKVHEKPGNVARWAYAPIAECEDGIPGGPHIHHLGYMDASESDWETKRQFYAELHAQEMASKSSEEM